MNINVHIERLILDGLPIAQRDRPFLQAAVESELTRLLATEGLASYMQAGGAMPRVQGSDVQLVSEDDIRHLGQQIARSLYIHKERGAQ